MLIDEIDKTIHSLFRQIAEEKGIELLAAGSLPDHAHLLVGLYDNQTLAWAMKMLKGLSSYRICNEFKMLKQDLKTNNFWARRYGARPIEINDLEDACNYVLNQKKDLHSP